MKIVLIILAVIVGLVILLFLLSRFLHWKMYVRGRPYSLEPLSTEERAWLESAYESTLKSEMGTFRGGGVWRKEPSMEQKSLLGAIRIGRLDRAQMDKLLEFVQLVGMSLHEANNSDPYIEEIYRKLDKIRYHY